MNSFSCPPPELRSRLLRAAKKRLKRIRKGIEEKKKSIDDCAHADKMQHLGDLLASHFHLLKPHMKEISLSDWDGNKITILLDPKLSSEKQIKAYYQKARKLKNGKVPLQKALEALLKEEEKHLALIDTLQTTFSPSALEQLQTEYSLCPDPKKAAPDEKPTRLFRFQSESAHTILVGKDATANDHLTFQLLKGADLWLHIEGKPGSHVGIRQQKEKEIDRETLLDAATLALYFSKARAHLDAAHEVIYTTRNCVHRIKGAPKGEVSVTKHKTLRLKIDPERLKRLKQ